MRFANRAGQAITTLDEWRTLGKPAAEHHWKPGRSAYELAADWIERDALARVTRLLAAGGLTELELVDGTAEKQTRFDEVPRGPRNHDLLVRGRAGGEPFVLAVEGKADEPFDRPLWRWRQEALARSPHSAAPQRLDRLTTLFFGTTIDRDAGWPSIACIGYQLLSALAGTLADARTEHATRAVLLVHEFVTDDTDDQRHAVNARVLDDFLARLAPSLPARTELADGWITVPIRARGDGRWMPDALPVQIAKLVTITRASAAG